MIDFYSALIGGFIGGIFSIISTFLVIKNERKVNYFQWLRNQKIDTYKGLSNVLSQINISLTINDNTNVATLNSEVFREYSEVLYAYISEHLGEFELFLPKETIKKVVKLKGLLYKVVSSNDSIIFNLEDFQNKKGLAYELVVVKTEIISILQRDLEVYVK